MITSITLAAGIYLIVLAAMINAERLHNRLLFKVGPAIVGAAALYAAAAMSGANL